MRMLCELSDNMYVFDMVVYVGMCPNSCMMNDVVCVLLLVWVVCQHNIVVYYYRCRMYNIGAG